MPELLSILRATHMLAGCAGLVLFWCALLAKKGGPAHVRSGRLFCWCTFYAGGTGLCFSIWAMLLPAQFFGEPPPDDALATVRSQVRFLYSITAFLAFAVLAGTALGRQLARVHRTPNRLRHPFLLGILAAYGLWSVGLIAAGAIALGSGQGGRGAISLTLGILGALGARDYLRQVFRPATNGASWRLQHMECMLGAGIGFHAAAFFFGAGFLGLGLEGAMRFVPMVVPFAIGVPLMWWWIGREERRLGKK